MPLVYVLKSINFDRKYTGSTKDNDINFRINYHNSGKVRSTKAYKPSRVAHVEEFESYQDARKRENFLKSGIGRKLLKEVLNNIEN